MTKGEAKELALRWLDEATINGEINSREQTADLTDKFNYFLNDALIFLSGFFRLPRVYCPAKPDGIEGGLVRYRMPEDFKELNKIVVTGENSYEDISDYRFEPPRDFLLAPEQDGTLKFLYWGNPREVTSFAPEEEILDVDALGAVALPLKLAADATAGSEDTMHISYYLEGKLSGMIVNLLQGRKEEEGIHSISTIYTQC